MPGTWKITIGTTDVADYGDVLKADPVSGGPVVQTESLAGAPVPAYFDRGNHAFIRKFTHTKQWADNAASAAWYMTDGPALAGVADVLLTHQAHDGSETVWKIAAAKIEISIDEPIGVTTISHLTITGGLPVEQA